MPTPVRIFVLYSAKDKKLGMSEDLETHLALLKRNAEVVVESEATIRGGQDLQPELEAGIDRAEIILILVSANLIMEHSALVDRALDRKKTSGNRVRVIPVLVRPFQLEGSPLAALRPLPSEQPVSAWKDEDEAWVVVVKGLRKVIEDVRANQSSGQPLAPPPPPKPQSGNTGAAPTSPAAKIKKILLVSANPSTDQRVAINQEFYEIKQRIERSTFRDQIKVEIELEIRVTDLATRLAQHQPHILVFSGHGAPEGAILLVDPNHTNQTLAMPLTALRDLVEILRDNLCCVVLNACYSAGDEPLAQSIAEVVGFAVGMNGEIDDRAAVLFSSSLLEMLAMGRTMQDAFRVAKTQIASMGVPGKDLPILKSATSADPSKFVLVS